MSDITAASCGNNCKSDNGFSPMMLILLLFLCGGDNGLLGGCGGSNSCGCNNGLDGILPILLLLLLCGGSF